MSAPRIAVLASGGGTTAEAFILAGVQGKISATVGLVICSREQAAIFERIKRLNKQYNLTIPCILINHVTNPPAVGESVQPGCQTKAEEAAIIDQLRRGNFETIVLMGYMKRVGPRLVHEFGWRPDYTSIYQAKMLNTHPGLLPQTKDSYGIHTQEFVLKQHLPYGGQTLHVVAEDYDDGPTVAEHKVPITPGDTPEMLFARVQTVEKKYLPADIDKFVAARQKYLQSRTKEKV